MSTPQEILAAIELLPPEDQRFVVQQVRDTYLLEEEWAPSETELAELDRRMEEIESGKVQAIPGSEVKRILRERMKRYE